MAVVQLTITLGATLGGLVFDAFGPAVNVAGSATILALAAGAAAFAGSRARA